MECLDGEQINKPCPCDDKCWETSCECCLNCYWGCCWVLCCPCTYGASAQEIRTWDQVIKLKFGAVDRIDPIYRDGLQCINELIYEPQIFDKREMVIDLRGREMLTKDFVTVRVDSVLFIRIVDAGKTLKNINNFQQACSTLTLAYLRAAVGVREFLELFGGNKNNTTDSEDEINSVTSSSTTNNMEMDIKLKLNKITAEKWGVEIMKVKIENMQVDQTLERAIAIEAESERIKQALILNAAGEIQIAKNLKKAAEHYVDNPAALQLRYFRTMKSISQQKNETYVFPIPKNIFPKAFSIKN